ncbi:MAG: alpha/beta fold hydrolase [Candidatus Omnitrophica bacterium]|nr:alpha/beta fold hydrolase [Candidatus Omnitrophota bacterium]MDD5552298.1 alpha/beta fold hydrolase [Candidatus Omnitrophota bacterium]
MISQESKFELIDRGFDRKILLIPGWAVDYRVFGGLELGYNYLLPTELNPLDFESALSGALEKENTGKISLLGWSMGGFLASDFASKNPDKVDELILAGIRRKYSPELLNEVKRLVTQNKRAFLYKLYLNSFSETDQEGLKWFREHLLDIYVNELDLDVLLSGLDYLSKAEINPASLGKIKKIKIIHGEEDKIASLDEALKVKSELPQAEFIALRKMGHFLFLNRQFTKSLSNE